MAEDEEYGGRGDVQAKQKRLLGEQLRRDFDTMLDEVWEASRKTMSINDLRKLVSVWMQSNLRTLEQFLYILDYSESHRVEHPADSHIFKDAFTKHAALCMAATLLEKIRDPFAWLAFMSGGSFRIRRKNQRRMGRMAEIGLK